MAAGAAAISLAAQGVIAVAGPWISAIDRASQAYLALSTSARAAALSVAAIGIGAAVVAGAAVYKGVKDYEHAQNGGSFEYDDLGNVTQKKDLRILRMIAMIMTRLVLILIRLKCCKTLF